MLPTKVDWSNWSSYFADADLWRGPIADVLGRHGFEPALVRPCFPGTSAAFAVECASVGAKRVGCLSGDPSTMLVVKFYPPMVWHDYRVETEVRSALRTCGSSVPYPRVIATGTYREGEDAGDGQRIEWPYIIEDFCPGQAIREVWGELEQAERNSLAAQIADVLSNLHRTPPDLLPTLNAGAARWREEAWKRAETCLDRLAAAEMLPGKRLPPSLIFGLGEFMKDHAGDVIDSVTDDTLRLLHNDMTEDHVFVERMGPESQHGITAINNISGKSRCLPWRITGLLDYGDAKVGPVQEELPVLWIGFMGMDPIAMRTFFRTYRGVGEQPAAGMPSVPNDIRQSMALAGSALHKDRGLKTEMLIFTLIHRFNAEIIREALKRLKVDPSSMIDLQTLIAIYLGF